MRALQLGRMQLIQMFFGQLVRNIFIIKDVLTWRDLVSKKCISSNWHVYIVQNMSRSILRILDSVFEGGGTASPKGKRIGSFWCQSGAIFEWSGSKFYELNCCILFVEPSAQISYMIFLFTYCIFCSSFCTIIRWDFECYFEEKM